MKCDVRTEDVVAVAEHAVAVQRTPQFWASWATMDRPVLPSPPCEPPTCACGRY